jgi:magnesium and cobalt transporter
MADQNSGNDGELAPPATRTSKSLFERLLSLIRREPEDRESIKALLEAAYKRQLLEVEAYTMIKGALAVSERTVGDIMVPRSRMDLLDIAQPLPNLLTIILETAHSRFPVFEGDRDNIFGILLAKDLLRAILNPSISLRTLIRPAVFIPESKRLNILLHDFRKSRNHLAIVIDEHGGIAGLVSLEDVLEVIVGDIEDEFDEEEVATIFVEGENQWRVQATTDIDKFNQTFGVTLPDHEYDTVGGWLGSELGRIPRRGDLAEREGLRIEVIRADPRRALWLRVQRVTAPTAMPATPAVPPKAP